ncbi:MAG: class I SAM-dependent methyltransferase [Rhodothalassiaceae bacterium]
MRFRLALAACLVSPLAAIAQDRPADVPIIDYYVDHNRYRTDEQMARDVYRNPAETLAFFGVQPHMTVTEQLPGWYTEILAPMLAEQGRYIAVNIHPDNYPDDPPERRARRMAFADRFITYSPMFGEDAQAAFLAGSSHQVEDASVDVALLFRAMHGMVYSDLTEAVLADYYRMLKPGGVLGIVQHRDDETSGYAATDRRGYLKQSDVIDMVTKAGFKLLATSEINANPKDPKTYERGVWTLPPMLTLGEENRATYEAIGESDRMTLKFIKPAN